jgi:TolA-binding protein
MSQDNSPQPSSGNRLVTALIAFMRALIRLLAIVVAGALIGGAIFYGVPMLYRQYIHPVQQTITRLNDAQAAQELTIQQLNQRIDRLNKRIEVLQIQSDTQKQSNAGLTSSIESVFATQVAMDESLQTMQASSSTRLDQSATSIGKI